MNRTIRVGIGYDIHRLVKGRKLYLGGVKIPYSLGLKGHSDADVLLHAVCDAILGAAGLGDIGEHFPDTSLKYKNVSSLELLKAVIRLVVSKGYKTANIDATVISEKPKITPYKKRMVKNIAKMLKIREDDVNIKATTNEGMGDIGKGKAIAAVAIAMIKNDK